MSFYQQDLRELVLIWYVGQRQEYYGAARHLIERTTQRWTATHPRGPETPLLDDGRFG